MQNLGLEIVAGLTRPVNVIELKLVCYMDAK